MSSDLQSLRMALEFLGYLSGPSVRLREWTSPSDASVIFIPMSTPWYQWKNSWGTKTRTSPHQLKVVIGHSFIPSVCCLPGPISLYSNQIIFISLSHIFMMLCTQFTTFSACTQHYHYHIKPLSSSFYTSSNGSLSLRSPLSSKKMGLEFHYFFHTSQNYRWRDIVSLHRDSVSSHLSSNFWYVIQRILWGTLWGKATGSWSDWLICIWEYEGLFKVYFFIPPNLTIG